MNDVVKDPWRNIRAATPARVALGRSGAGLLTQTHLDFQFAHARARDAVHQALDVAKLKADLAPLPAIEVSSAAPDRQTYLRRPDLGRQLGEGEWSNLFVENAYDIVFVIADGLSCDAVQTHAAPVIHKTIDLLQDFQIAPVVIATQARVAIGDPIGEKMGAQLVVLLVGERPGLTVADSLGAYLTFAPKSGRMDSERNCISNIHEQGGLSHESAAQKINWLCREAMRLGLTGTGLKEDSQGLMGAKENFSLPEPS